MARRDHLTTLRRGRLSQNLIDLPLPEDLKVRVWFVKQQHSSRMRIKMSEQKQSLLEASTRTNQI